MESSSRSVDGYDDSGIEATSPLDALPFKLNFGSELRSGTSVPSIGSSGYTKQQSKIRLDLPGYSEDG